MAGGPSTFVNKMLTRGFNDTPVRFRRAPRAGRGSGKTDRDLLDKAPIRSSFAMRDRRPVSMAKKVGRAIYCGMVFGIIGGGIALFATGTGIRDGYWTRDGLIVAACLAVFGGVVGYFSGKK
jgi:hypothetical protein